MEVELFQESLSHFGASSPVGSDPAELLCLLRVEGPAPVYQRREVEVVGNLNKQVEVAGVEEEAERIPLLHHLLCWVLMGQEGVGRWMVVGEEAGCGRRSDGRASRTAVRDKMNRGALVVAVEDCLCLTEEVGVVPLHVLTGVTGPLAGLTGPG